MCGRSFPSGVCRRVSTHQGAARLRGANIASNACKAFQRLMSIQACTRCVSGVPLPTPRVVTLCIRIVTKASHRTHERWRAHTATAQCVAGRVVGAAGRHDGRQAMCVGALKARER